MHLRVALLALLSACLVLGGCQLGKKTWPRPQKSEDRFSFGTIRAGRDQGCLLIEIEIQGAAQNIALVSVLFESVGRDPGDGCPTCPFIPRQATSYSPGRAGFVLSGNTLRITHCGLTPGKTYRWKVTAANVYPVLGVVETGVFELAP
ncbi:MAG: hypothetical protein PHV85_09790 [Desulfovibrionaceae bacterium]|nr:hypothetical protein [Desulfovibrionaceae bacterium]MDD4952828.1 hypothetical protein [Desulfovibrionaceae bacterium]